MSFIMLTRIGLLAMPLLGPVVSAAALQSRNGIVPNYSGGNCYHEPPSNAGRALKGKSTNNDRMHKDECALFCKDYKYFGTEFGRECFCGNDITTGAVEIASAECTMTCTGRSTEKCGAPDRLNIYKNEDYRAPSVKTDITGWTYQGCHTEADGGRALKDKQYSEDNMTPELCASNCAGLGYNFAGVEWGRECFCGKTISGGTWAPESDCSKLCSGDPKSFCGEGGRLNIYAQVPPITATVASATYLGCAIDSQTLRVLENGKRTASDDMTADTCATYCNNYSYKYFGIENGRECFCANEPSSTPQYATASECNAPCAGDGKTLCGAKGRLSLYQSTKTPSTNAVTGLGNFKYLQCGLDNVSDRALKGEHFATDDMTPGKCASLCANYRYFGLEFGKECFCGNEYNKALEKPAGDCYMKCSGNNGVEICGAGDRLSVYTTIPQLCPNPTSHFGVCTTYAFYWLPRSRATTSEEDCRNEIYGARFWQNMAYNAYYYQSAASGGGVSTCYGMFATVESPQCDFQSSNDNGDYGVGSYGNLFC
ncbi:copper radical oxidase [Colletotrichum truncatum]|uniref:Copper radical oxidase n=1 Tax=Colletotrichum truncatum TaxID=5467 RepID=A0ACC3YKR6_COLTU|nr:copper radical oxidase [Colletotrichum truncatum]KAF6783456.1 copper radical oxidase [Colletotrichum truncatum]